MTGITRQNVPERIGPYRIENRLGVGDSAWGYRAHDDSSDRWVALKPLLPDEEDDPSARQRILEDARAACQLDHPNIARIFGLVRQETGDWIAMELVEGQPLNIILRAGALLPRRALALGTELATGLESAHSKNVIHRDLKATNVMITAQDHAKILDFGLARPLEYRQSKTSLSMDGEVVGTPRAMSPEQAQGGVIDHRSDLFSFGILLYEMLTGVSPFVGTTLIGTLKRVCVHRQRPAHEIAPIIPRELSVLVDLLLEKDPVDRPPSAAEVARALQRVSFAGERNYL